MYLQKYVTKKKLISFLNEGLYFRKSNKFEDRTEGDYQHFGSRQKNILNSMKESAMFAGIPSEEQAKALTCSMKDHDKNNNFIQSWHKNNLMSERMWNEYSRFLEDKNCALIVIDPFALNFLLYENLSSSWKFDIVKYVENKQEASSAFFTKDVSFSWEREERICINMGEIILGNKDILPEMECFIGARGITVKGVDLPRVKNIFKYVNEDGFILELPGLSAAVKGILIPNEGDVDFENEINDVLRSENFEARVKKVDINCRDEIKNLF